MEEINGVIYIYTNKNDGKVYIGQTIHEDDRMKYHKYAYDDTPFEKAIKEEGWNSFNYNVLYRVKGWDKKNSSQYIRFYGTILYITISKYSKE